MAAALSIQRLYELYRHKLGLSGLDLFAASNADATLGSLAEIKIGTHSNTLIGHINPIRKCLLQVFGHLEHAYYEGLDGPSQASFMRQVLGGEPVCIIVADDLPVPTSLSAESVQIPVIRAQASSQHVITELQNYLSRINAPLKSVHGVFIEVMGVGVLLTGQPGVGKSELALELISRGHRLIADDAPEFSLLGADDVVGSCPDALQDFMEVRGLGIINVRALFGDSAVKSHRSLRLVISLEFADEKNFNPDQRLDGIRRQREIHGVNISEVALPIAPGHNMAVLVEATVRNFILRSKGYDAAEDFSKRQNQFMMSRKDSE